MKDQADWLASISRCGDDGPMLVAVGVALLGDTSSKLGDTQTWALMGLGASALIYVAIIRPAFRKKDPLEKPHSFGSLSQQRAVERQMQNLLVELSEMARQISGQLDTRAAKLQQLIHDADHMIEQLKSATQTNVYAMPSAPAMSQHEYAPQPPPTDPRHAEVYGLADQGRDANEIATQLNRPRGEIDLILALRGR